jgi:hypothetical protein
LISLSDVNTRLKVALFYGEVALSLRVSPSHLSTCSASCNSRDDNTRINIPCHKILKAGPIGRAVLGVGLRQLARCDREFESDCGHRYLSFVYVVCFQVEVSATRLSLVQRSPTDSGVSLCVIKEPRGRGGHSPGWAAEPEKIKTC